MGTNFYYKIPLSKRKVKELQDLITEDPNFSNFQEQLKEVEENHCIHLGKRSAGWQFLWNYHNGKYYDASLESIKQFLLTGGGYIESEYAEKISVDTFFDEEIGISLYKDDKHCDLASYYEKYPKEQRCCNPTDEEFSSDGLRFSRYTNFS